VPAGEDRFVEETRPLEWLERLEDRLRGAREDLSRIVGVEEQGAHGVARIAIHAVVQLEPAIVDAERHRRTTGAQLVTNGGCAAFAPGSLTGKIALIRRGTCTFFQKASNAQAAGAAAVVLYNNVAGQLNPTVAGATPITIPVVALSGTNTEVVITVCWEISWYQYRVALGTSQVRLAQRGLEPAELDDSFKDWNAELNDAGLVVPKLPEH